MADDSQPKKRRRRQSLPPSELKRRKHARQVKFSKSRIYLGCEQNRWLDLKDHLGFKTDREVATLLLDLARDVRQGSRECHASARISSLPDRWNNEFITSEQLSMFNNRYPGCTVRGLPVLEPFSAPVDIPGSKNGTDFRAFVLVPFLAEGREAECLHVADAVVVVKVEPVPCGETDATSDNNEQQYAMTAHKTKYYCSTDQVKTKHNSGQNRALNGKENVGQSGQLTCSAVNDKLVMERLDMEDENMPDKEAFSRMDSVEEAMKSDKQNQGSSRLCAKKIPNYSKLLDDYDKLFDEEDHKNCVVDEGEDSGTLKTQSNVKENSSKKNPGVDSDWKDCHESDNAAVQLDNHLKSHKDSHQYQCDQCSLSFLHKSQLTSHMRTHTGEKPFHCDQCTYAAAWNVQLKEHKKLHELTTSVICGKCGTVVKNDRCLQTHMKRIHSNTLTA